MRLLLVAIAAIACSSSPPAAPTLAVSHPEPPVRVEDQAAASESPVNPVVASWKGGQITAESLSARVDTELRNRRIRFMLEEYEVQAQALDVLVMESLLDAEVHRRGLSDIDALMKTEVEDKIPEPTEAEIAEFWPVVERQLPGATLDEARPLVVAELLRRARQDRYGAYVEELRQSSGLEILLPYPDLPRVDLPLGGRDPARGPADAPVTVVQFAEYQCYYCNQVRPSLDRLFDEFDGKVRVVWKDFPLSNHGRALPAAVAARCAGEQGRYWEMNAKLLENQHALGDASIAGYAGELGLDTEPFESCLASGRFDDQVRADMSVGQELGVRATPTFFINGVLLSGAQPYERFKALVERELEGA
jgi:protein-disulfide isomerase